MIGNFLAAEAKVPLIAVAADFQKSPQALMSHPGVGLDKWEDLPRAKPVYLGAAAINTFYAWLKLEYGFKDENIRPYNFNSAPFIANKNSIQQGYVTGEPFEIEKQGPPIPLQEGRHSKAKRREDLEPSSTKGHSSGSCGGQVHSARRGHCPNVRNGSIVAEAGGKRTLPEYR